MNIRQIEYVLAVAKYKNFGKAADSCFITQSTLSTMVNRFEKELDVMIFDRKTKPVSVTHEGQAVINQLNIINKEVQSLEELVKNLKGEFWGSLHIGIIPTIAPFIYPKILNDFSKSFPAVNFKITEMPTAKIISSLLSRDLDIGIVSIPLKHKDLEELPLYSESFKVYDKGLESTSKSVEIENLDVNRLWLLEEGHCMKNQVEQICGLRQKKQIHSNLSYKSGTIPTLMKLVDHNKGLTLLPYLSTIDMPQAQRAFLKEFNNPIPGREVGLLIHKHFVKRDLLKKLEYKIKATIQPILDNDQPKNTFDPLS
jgi:LysR family hydrogen peroxide-inducible transcriptional activator